MRIAMFSRWNAADGVSVHAEFVGREWVKRGHYLRVFAPFPIRKVAEDENWVTRCASDEGDKREGFLDPRPILQERFDIIVVQRVEWFPLEPLAKIFPKASQNAKTVYVAHERRLPEDPLFYRLKWDKTVVFDERYRKTWLKKFAEEAMETIPYPTGHLRKGDKKESRRELNLPLEEKIIFSYGWAPDLHIYPILPWLEELHRDYPFKFLVLGHPRHSLASLEPLHKYSFVELRHELSPLDRIYQYLFASDIYLMHKEKKEIREGEAVVPSAILMCLGALTPVITSDTEFVWFLNKEVMKYSTRNEFKELIIETFQENEIVKQTLDAAEEYVINHSPQVVAQKFIDLFNRLG